MMNLISDRLFLLFSRTFAARASELKVVSLSLDWLSTKLTAPIKKTLSSRSEESGHYYVQLEGYFALCPNAHSGESLALEAGGHRQPSLIGVVAAEVPVF